MKKLNKHHKKKIDSRKGVLLASYSRKKTRKRKKGKESENNGTTQQQQVTKFELTQRVSQSNLKCIRLIRLLFIECKSIDYSQSKRECCSTATSIGIAANKSARLTHGGRCPATTTQSKCIASDGRQLSRPTAVDESSGQFECKRGRRQSRIFIGRFRRRRRSRRSGSRIGKSFVIGRCNATRCDTIDDDHVDRHNESR